MKTVNNAVLQPRTDCWAFENDDCSILTECLCKKKKCSHFQTIGELKRKKDKCAERHAMLGLTVKKTAEKITVSAVTNTAINTRKS